MYTYDEIISTPDNVDDQMFKTVFLPVNSNTQILSSEPYKIIMWLFEDFNDE